MEKRVRFFWFFDEEGRSGNLEGPGHLIPDNFSGIVPGPKNSLQESEFFLQYVFTRDVLDISECLVKYYIVLYLGGMDRLMVDGWTDDWMDCMGGWMTG